PRPTFMSILADGPRRSSSTATSVSYLLEARFVMMQHGAWPGCIIAPATSSPHRKPSAPSQNSPATVRLVPRLFIGKRGLPKNLVNMTRLGKLIGKSPHHLQNRLTKH